MEIDLKKEKEKSKLAKKLSLDNLGTILENNVNYNEINLFQPIAPEKQLYVKKRVSNNKVKRQTTHENTPHISYSTAIQARNSSTVNNSLLLRERLAIITEEHGDFERNSVSPNNTDVLRNSLKKSIEIQLKNQIEVVSPIK